MFDFSTQLWRLRAGIFCKMKKIEDLKQFIIENWSKEKADQIPASDFAVQISNIEEIKRNFNEEDKTYFVERKYKASVLILGILKTSGESTLAALVRKYFQEFGHPGDEYSVSSEELLDSNKVIGNLELDVWELVQGTHVDESMKNTLDVRDLFFWGGEYYREDLMFPQIEALEYREHLQQDFQETPEEFF